MSRRMNATKLGFIFVAYTIVLYTVHERLLAPRHWSIEYKVKDPCANPRFISVSWLGYCTPVTFTNEQANNSASSRPTFQYIVHETPKKKPEANLDELYSFLYWLSTDSDVNTDTSLKIHFFKPNICLFPRENTSVDQLFKHRPSSCSWWRLILSGFGYRVTFNSADSSIVANVLDRALCGCACDATTQTQLLQGMNDFFVEYNLTQETPHHGTVNLQVNENKHASCALVLSSGSLGLSDPPLGTLIDKHDAVFRFNHAPSGGEFGRIAGYKTTYRLAYVPLEGDHPEISPPRIENLDNGTLLLTVHYRSRAKSISNYDLLRIGGVGVISTNFRAEASKCIHEKFNEHPYSEKPPTGPHLSQGILGVFVALKLCERTIIFGKQVGLSAELKRMVPYHYYDTDGTNPNSHYGTLEKVHASTKEDKFVQQLADTGTLSIVSGMKLY